MSLHSTNAATAQQIFGKSYDLDTVLVNARALQAVGLSLTVNCLLSSQSKDNVRDLVRLSADLGAAQLRVLGLVRQGRAAEHWSAVAIHPSEAKAAVGVILETAADYGLPTEVAGLPSFARCSHSDQFGKCLGGKAFFHITTDGSLYPCPAAKCDGSRRLGGVGMSPSELAAPNANRLPCEPA